MKKSGIINQQLINQIAGLGHGDEFIICDAGFPIPKGTDKTDLAIVKGVPTTYELLCAILSEVIIEKVAMAKECIEEELLINQKKEIISQSELISHAKEVKFIVRTGDITPYANIILTAASGISHFNKDLEIK
jgi:D-ribose pyranase